MITVLFVAAALTAVVSAAAFATVSEIRSGGDDRRGAEALAYAESGIDRLIHDIRGNVYNTAQMRLSGCSGQPALQINGQVGKGSFNVKLEVYPLTSTECNARVSDNLRATPGKLFAITSTGTHPTARRVIRMLVRIQVRGLPLAVYANSVEGGGTPKLSEVSLLTPGNIANRDNIGFRGQDNVYRIGDFWCYPLPAEDPACTVANKLDFAPSAAHAAGVINCAKQVCPGPPEGVEHSSTFTLNCDANPSQGANSGTAGQSQWDQSGNGGPITEPACVNWLPAADPLMPDNIAGPPPSSSFTTDQLSALVPEPGLSDEDYVALRDSARARGLYCFVPAGSSTYECTRAGVPMTPAKLVGAAWQSSELAGLPNNLVAYIEWEDPSNTEAVNWSAGWGSSDSVACDPNQPADQRKTLIMIVRNGGFRLAGTTPVNGALFVPEGELTDSGTFHWNGPIFADSFDRSGTGLYSLDECWLGTMPGPFVSVTPVRWQEVDR